MSDDQYVEGTSLVYGSRAFSFVGGTSLGGLLVQALSTPFAIAADALSFPGSAFFLHRIKPVNAPAADCGGVSGFLRLLPSPLPTFRMPSA